jgi:mRNA interferase RelE/StbE
VSWNVILSPGALREYRKLSRQTKGRIRQALAELQKDPWARPYKKLKGYPFYRIRVGDWRVVYHVDEDAREIHVVKIEKRKRVYKRL